MQVIFLHRRNCIKHSRFTKQDGWQLWDLSLSLNGNIAVTGLNENTYRTCIDVYTNVRHSDSRDKPKLIYSKEFEKYSYEKFNYKCRYISFIDDDVLLSCLGDKLEVFQVNEDKVLRSRRVNSITTCLSVRERREIFIGFYRSNKITVYDVIDLNEIKSIILQGIQDGYYLFDMTAMADRIFVSISNGKKQRIHKSLIIEEKNGRILSELQKPTDSVQWYVFGLALNITENLIAVAWSQTFEGTRKGKDVIVLYSLLSENYCSFLTFESDPYVTGIRMSERGDRIVWINDFRNEIKVFDMAELFTYSHFKEKMASTLQTDECTKLANFFKIPKDQAVGILKSKRPSENLFLALEEKGILQPYNAERLRKAFEELTINPFCLHVAEIFLKTRSSAFYIEHIEKLEEKISKLQKASEDKKRHLKEKTTEVEDLQKEQKEVRKLQETLLKVTREREKLKAENDKAQLQLSSLQEELRASKKAKTETEKVLKQTEELLQKIIQEKNEIKTELKQLQVERSFRSMSLEEERKNQEESGKVSEDTTDDSASTSQVKSKYWPESLLGDEFAKLLVKVSERLNNSNCIKMATYFNLPESKIDLLQKESEMPGIRLFRLLKERNIINMYDVTQLQEVLSVLYLLEVNETLVKPYQSHIDPLLYQKNKVRKQEH